MEPTTTTVSPSQRWQPVAYLGLAVILLLVALPTVLRPSQERPTSAAEFSPDAPPETPEQPLFEALEVAKSGTAGAGEGEGPPGEGPGGEGGGAGGGGGGEGPPVPTPQPSACPFGFGEPPRQIESVYAPPCAAAFKGDNGGATYAGVTESEIRIGFLMDLTGTGTANGEIKGEKHDDTAPGRTYAAWQRYFNQRYQFYGRRVRFFLVEGTGSSGDGEEDGRAKAQNAAVKYDIFGAIQEINTGAMNELVRRKIPTFTLSQVAGDVYTRSHPYLWSFTPDASRLVRMGGEYLCKRLKGRAPFPREAGDPHTPGMNVSGPRRFGIISIDNENYRRAADEMETAMARCGAENKLTVRYKLDGDAGTEEIGLAMARLKNADVTTVVFLGDLTAATAFTHAADSNAYYPEWFLPGFGGADLSVGSARGYSQQQWRHAFGFTMYEVPVPRNETECYKAYHEIDPGGNPDSGMCQFLWGHVVQLLGGIQQAGPNLTAETFARGMQTYPKQSPQPFWKMTGSYSATDKTYPDYAAEIWWDPLGINPTDGGRGTYMYVDGARRYTDGEWPTSEPQVFREGRPGRQ